MTLVDFGQTKVTRGKQGSKSNSTKLYTIPGRPRRPPAAAGQAAAGCARGRRAP